MKRKYGMKPLRRSRARRAEIPFFCLMFATAFRMAVAAGLDYTFMTQRSFSSAQLSGLGDAGIALPGDIGTGMRNPALLYAFLKNSRGAVSAGYGRDSLFNRHIIPCALGYASGNGALGGYYRYQSGEGPLSQHEAAFNLSGVLFGNRDVQGEVDFGVSVRYGWMSATSSNEVFLRRKLFLIDSAGKEVYQSTIDSSDTTYRRKTAAKRFIADIGFYQPNFIEHLDFALVLSNILGYSWEKERPIPAATGTTEGDSVIGTETVMTVERSYSLIDEESSSRGWLSGRYRTLIFGIVYRVEPAATLQLSFPVDLELLGLFDRKVENRFVFRGGIAAMINTLFIVRLGYARQPKTILEGITSFKNVNVFTGGAGVFISGVSFDVTLSQQSFGMTAGYRF
ncbi:MAG: hypothetical protein JXA18_03440 [Chitinispirillaceae bacterium]|nr:hypothetical protein [Chitinispirillaceae bacterium]